MYIKHKIVIDCRFPFYSLDLMTRKLVAGSNHSFDMQKRDFFLQVADSRLITIFLRYSS